MKLEDSKSREYLVRRIDRSLKYDDLVDFPRYFEIETINACNARCPFCTIEEWERDTPVMADDVFDRIASQLADNRAKVKRVSLYRDGEPLLDKKLPARIRRLKDDGLDLVAISTNVSLLDERRSTEILEAGIDQVLLSIDSMRADVFESLRVKLKFNQVLENALRFVELRNRIRPETQVWVRMIRQKENLDEWPEYERFWRPKLATHDRLNYKDLHNWGGQLKGFEAVSPTYELGLPCVALWSLMVIFANGDIPLCNVDFNNRHPLGNVMVNTIEELWQSQVARERRRLHLDGEKAKIDICANCNVWGEPADWEESVSADFGEKVTVPA